MSTQRLRISIADAYLQGTHHQRRAARLVAGLTDRQIRELQTDSVAPWVVREIAKAVGVPLHEIETGDRQWQPRTTPGGAFPTNDAARQLTTRLDFPPLAKNTAESVAVGDHSDHPGGR